MKSPYLGKRFIVGVVIELGAIILCIWISNQIYYGGGWPFVQLFFTIVYVIGSINIYKSMVPRIVKHALVFWWLGALVIWLAYMFAWYGIESMQTSDETFLIPADYHGQVIVNYNQPDGEAVNKEDGRLLFKVKKDGTVSTIFKRHLNEMYPNNTHPQFYYVDEAGNRTRLKIQGDSTIQAGEVFVQLGAFYNDEGASSISKQDFLVFTSEELDSYHNPN